MSKRNWRDLENRITRLQSRYERDAAIAQVKRNETYQTIRSNWSKIALWLGGIAIATYLCVGGVNWISNIGSGATSQREEPAAEVYNSPTVEEVVETPKQVVIEPSKTPEIEINSSTNSPTSIPSPTPTVTKTPTPTATPQIIIDQNTIIIAHNGGEKYLTDGREVWQRGMQDVKHLATFDYFDGAIQTFTDDLSWWQEDESSNSYFNIAPLSNIRLSPTLDKVLYTPLREGGLVIVNFANSEIIRIPTPLFGEECNLLWEPVWSPDGEKIAFICRKSYNIDPHRNFSLISYDLESSTYEVISRLQPWQDWPLTLHGWALDGSFLFSNGNNLGILSPNDEFKVILDKQGIYDGKAIDMSTDGTKIALAHGTSLGLINSNGTGYQELINKNYLDNLGFNTYRDIYNLDIFCAMFSQDDKKILFNFHTSDQDLLGIIDIETRDFEYFEQPNVMGNPSLYAACPDW